MRKITSIICLVAVIAMCSCDGRKKAFRSAQNDLIKNEILDSFTETIRYYPKEYTEIVSDTILNNGYNMHIRLYSDMENAVIVEGKDNTHYRPFIVDVTITKENIKNKRRNNLDFFENKSGVSSSETKRVVHS